MKRGTIRFNDKGEIIEISDKENVVKISIITQGLAKRLMETKEGDLVSYAELEGAAGMKVQAPSDGYAYLYSALRIVERMGRHFAVVRGNGYERISGEQVALNGPNRCRQVAKRARREIARMQHILDFDSMSREAKDKFWLSSTILGFQAAAANKQSIAAIEEKVRISNGTLPTSEMLEALKR